MCGGQFVYQANVHSKITYNMKTLLALTATATLVLSACSTGNSDVTIHLPDDFTGKTLVVSHVVIDNLINAQRVEDLNEVFDTIEVVNGVAHMQLDKAGASRYNISSPVPALKEAEFYASPGDELNISIGSFNPLNYSVTGSELMNDLTILNSITDPIQQDYFTYINSSENVSVDEARKILARYDEAIKKFVADNPTSPAVPLAITNLSPDDFKPIYDQMSQQARGSILMPYAEAYDKQVEEILSERAMEQARKDELASGVITAPDFTLPDLTGKNVSLTDFKGKWVVLDFWGSWCGWCVKGFPALKEAHEKYGDRIVVIGIDCNETEEAWRQGVDKYELPWINLFNGDNRTLYSDYNIQGFPTKAIINPEGKLVDLTTGEDPTFFNRLASFMK